MHQKIAVIAQDPLALLVAFDAVRPFAALAQLSFDLIGDGLVLARIGAGTDHEVVGEGGDFSEVKHADAGCLFFLRGPNRGQPVRFCFVSYGVFLVQNGALNRYRTMGKVRFRLFALLVFAVASLCAQSDAPDSGPPAREVPPLAADMTDPLVVRAQQNVDQIRKLVEAGALPLARLRKAQDDVQDAMDMTILKRNLYSTDLLPEQADQMIYVAERMVLRRQRALADTQQLVGAGVLSRSEAEGTQSDLDRARSELELATTRAKLIEQIATNVRMQKGMADLENEALSHPDWNGKVYFKYEGSGLFTDADRKAVEFAFAGKFARPLPISADGETAVHRSFGFDHRGRLDVALSPDQPEGIWLMKFLEQRHIPYFAFRAAVPHKATGAHIHLGPESTRLGATE